MINEDQARNVIGSTAYDSDGEKLGKVGHLFLDDQTSRPEFVSVNTGGSPDGNAIPGPKPSADPAMDAAACIGCGACVAACKNASAALFTSAKISHLGLLPQGEVERYTRVAAMVHRHDAEGFGSCSNEGECEAVCPKEIPITNIARMNRDYFRAMLVTRD